MKPRLKTGAESTSERMSKNLEIGLHRTSEHYEEQILTTYILQGIESETS